MSEPECSAKVLETIDFIGKIVNVELDRRALSIVVSLIDQGFHPESIAEIILEIKSSSNYAEKNA